MTTGTASVATCDLADRTHELLHTFLAVRRAEPAGVDGLSADALCRKVADVR